MTRTTTLSISEFICNVSFLVLKVSGVRCQESKKTKTCWGAAEIPSEAKRQRETLKPASEAARHALGQKPLLALSHEKFIGHTCNKITDHFRG